MHSGPGRAESDQRTASFPSKAFQVHVVPDFKAVSQQVAEVVIGEIRTRPDLLFCAAAGSSPSGAYQVLGERAVAEPDLFARLRVIQIDEWGGLSRSHPATCEADLIKKLLVPLHVGAERYEGFHSDPADPEKEAARVARWLERHGPIDLCVLGLGMNGHLAMNEPSEALCPHPHVARLTPSSLDHPMLAACSSKPSYGLTLGMGDLLRSRKILLPVCGHPKRDVLRQLLRPTVSPWFPASFLWLHPDVTVICDEEAAGDIAVKQQNNP
jgi:galactosamine-6-phosphate isomerase